MKERTTAIAIIGGGIAGLAAAYHLRSKAKETGQETDCLLLEAQNRLGGKILTEKVDGFIIEGGPDCFISEKPAALQLCHKLEIQNHLMKTDESHQGTFILWKGKLHKLPEGFMLLAPSDIPSFLKDPLITPLGKLRMAMDLILPGKKSSAEETLAQFVQRRLGKEVLDKIADPLVAGIHASDPATMSLRSTFPRFIELEHHYRSIIRGMMKRKKQYLKYKKKSGYIPQYSLFMTLKDGLSELPHAVASTLNRRAILTGKKVIAIERITGNVTSPPRHYALRLSDGTTVTAQAVIAATPSFIAGDLVKDLDQSLAGNLNAIRYVSTATVSLAYRDEDSAARWNGFGFVIPHKEKRKIMASTWSSNKFFNRAPHGNFLIRCFVGGARNEDLALLAERQLIALVREELADIMGITAEPLLARAYRWEKSMPQYVVGHSDTLKRIDERLQAHPGLFLAGSAYRGIGISDCIKSGDRAAMKALEYINT